MEACFELAWKTLNDYLTESGIVIAPVTPRQVIKDAFAAKIIDDGQLWMDMLVERGHGHPHARYLNALLAPSPARPADPRARRACRRGP